MPLASPIHVVGLYVGINLVLLLVLAARCSIGRFSKRIAVGDGGDRQFEKVVRAHANAAEYIPAMLVALGALALMGAPTVVIHAIGAPFTLARLAHGYGMAARGVSVFRRLGAGVSMLTFLIAAAACVYYALT